MMTVELKIVNTQDFPITGRATVWFFSEDQKPLHLVPQFSGIRAVWAASQCSVSAVARLHDGTEPLCWFPIVASGSGAPAANGWSLFVVSKVA